MDEIDRKSRLPKESGRLVIDSLPAENITITCDTLSERTGNQIVKQDVRLYMRVV